VGDSVRRNGAAASRRGPHAAPPESVPHRSILVHVASLAALVGCAGTPRPSTAASAAAPVPAVAAPADSVAAHPSATPPWFYKRRNFGSEAFFDPLSEILNEGYDFLQIHGRDRHFLDFPYGAGFRVIGRSIAHPDRAMRKYGWDYIVREELLPLSGPEGSGAWIPNYQLHLLGGGMAYARMEEWYAAHGARHPKLPAIVTMGTAHLLNELIEDAGARVYAAGPLIDLFVFDAAGIALFQSARVRRFAAITLGMTNWPGIPSIQRGELTIENASQNYVIQWRPPHGGHWRVFGYMGIGNMLGVAHRWDGGDGLSIAGGLQGGEVIPLSERSDRRTVSLYGQAGAFWDHDGSLLASLVASGSRFRGIEVNVYPEALRIAGTPLALWAHLPREGKPMLGLAVPIVPGLATTVR
jgi:hypothetical protein